MSPLAGISVAAIRHATANRPEPKDEADARLGFITKDGLAWRLASTNQATGQVVGGVMQKANDLFGGPCFAQKYLLTDPLRLSQRPDQKSGSRTGSVSQFFPSIRSGPIPGNPRFEEAFSASTLLRSAAYRLAQSPCERRRPTRQQMMAIPEVLVPNPRPGVDNQRPPAPAHLVEQLSCAAVYLRRQQPSEARVLRHQHQTDSDPLIVADGQQIGQGLRRSRRPAKRPAIRRVLRQGLLASGCARRRIRLQKARVPPVAVHQAEPVVTVRPRLESVESQVVAQFGPLQDARQQAGLAPLTRQAPPVRRGTA